MELTMNHLIELAMEPTMGHLTLYAMEPTVLLFNSISHITRVI